MISQATQLSLFPDGDELEDLPEFSVRESARAKRLSIKVFPRGRVEVVVPRRTRPQEIETFIEEHRDWIDRSRQAFAEVAPPEPFRLPETVDLPAIGRRFQVRYERLPGRQGVQYRSRDHVVALTGRTDEELLCVTALKRWLASVARREFAPRLEALAERTGHPYRAMHIRGQRTRWGSYSSTGTVSLNYCLLFLDPELLRYLIVHELCHARHLNHSRRFWRLVEHHEPDYRRLDKALADSWKRVPIWLGMH